MTPPAEKKVRSRDDSLLVTPFSSEQFTASIEGGVTQLVTEASSLMDDNGGDGHLRRLYSHSNEVGLAIQFERRREVAAYYLNRINYSPDFPNQIDGWEYLPTSRSIERVSQCKNTVVLVFND